MNLSQVSELKDGDEVEFIQNFRPFTVGKKYKVRETGVGVHVYDDNGIGHSLASTFHLEHHFSANHANSADEKTETSEEKPFGRFSSQQLNL